MFEEFEYRGDWWFPNNPEKIGGTLKFTPDEGGVLELVSSSTDISSVFQNLKDSFSDSSSQIEIILGRCHDGKNFKNITLFNSLQTKFRCNLVGYGTVKCFSPELIFVGYHFEKTEDIKFQSLHFYYSHLSEWIGKFFLVSADFNEIIKGGKLLPELPPIIDEITLEDMKVSVKSSLSVSFRRSNVQNEINIVEKPYLQIEATMEKSWEEYKKYDSLIRTFLSLWISKPIYILSIEGKTHDSSIEIYGRQKIVTKSLFPDRELCSFNDISDSFSVYLKKWFEKVKILEDVCNLYSAILYNPQIHIEYIFLSLVFAMESYHRRIHDGKYQSDDVYCNGLYKDLLKSIPDNTDTDFKDSLRGILKYLNEYSLRKRLKDLFNTKRAISHLIKDSGELINNVVNTRNDLAHKGKDNKKFEELYGLCLILKVLFEVCLLYELDVSEEMIENMVSSRIDSYFTVKAVRDELARYIKANMRFLPEANPPLA